MAHDAPSDNPYTRGIAEFVSNLEYDAIPENVRSRIKLLMLDSLGCALYGADLEWTRILQDTLGKIDTTRSCSVWGTKRKLSAPHSALVNGTQVQGFELDDVHRAGALHVGAVVLPALLAVAELRPGMTGREFLAARAGIPGLRWASSRRPRGPPVGCGSTWSGRCTRSGSPGPRHPG